MTVGKPIRVLIVDDSALMRQVLTSILSAEDDICVVDTASDPLSAREKIKKHCPDVVTLDVEMPRMSGLDFLNKIMTLRPMPVVMISSLTQAGADHAIKALELGAFDAVGKPSGLSIDGMAPVAAEIVAKVRAAAGSRIAMPTAVRPVTTPQSGLGAGAIIAIGASTGGIPAISTIVADLPAGGPPVVIVQHMPGGFTARLAERLNAASAVTVCEGRDGQPLQAGHVYIAPGGYMMTVQRSGGQDARLRVRAEPPVNGFCPSVDVMFDSVAREYGRRAVAALLTGMGADGARGLLRLRQAGAFTIGQDEKTCVVYGMPRVAFELGAVCQQLPIERIAAGLLRGEALPEEKQPKRAVSQRRFNES